MHEAPKLVRQEELLNLLLLHIPLRDCAERLHISYNTVRKYASEPEFLDNLRNLSQSTYAEVIEALKYERKTLQQRMLEASDRALERLEELINSQSEPIALKACDSVLDRNTETARNKKFEADVHGKFTFDPLTLMHAALTANELDTAQANTRGELQSGVTRDGSYETHALIAETVTRETERGEETNDGTNATSNRTTSSNSHAGGGTEPYGAGPNRFTGTEPTPNHRVESTGSNNQPTTSTAGTGGGPSQSGPVQSSKPGADTGSATTGSEGPTGQNV